VLTINTAASYIPGAVTVQSTIHGKEGATTNEENMEDIGKSPTRPDNDVQVEEFLKKQYRSTSRDDGTSKLNADST
jgi:hypothetical protein